MITRRLFALGAAALFALSGASQAFADDKSIILQSTTSTANSGLYDHILPIFTEKTGITVHVVAVGTGQAIKNAKNGDGDVLLVHAKPAEEKFVAEGYGVKRFDVMYNDFIVVGPPADPAGVAGLKTDRPRWRKSPRPRRRSLRGATIPAPIRRNCAFGKRPRSTPVRIAAPGTGRPDRAWAQRSTSRSAWAPMP